MAKINTLEYSKIFQQALDQQMLAVSTTAWMEANAGQVQYNGGDTVKIPTISTSGLGNYDRDNGFVQGAVTLKYEDYKMTQDRGRTFHLDAMDVNETNFVANAGVVLNEFQRLQVVPEVDAYRVSKLASLIAATDNKTQTFDVTKDNILDKLEEELTKIYDVVGEGIPLVIMMSTPVRSLLNNAKFDRYIDVGNFKNGSVDTRVKTFNDVPILSIPSARMKTQYVFNDGKSSSQEVGGFKADSGAKGINWLIMPAGAPIAVSKTDKVRIFTPDQNQKADAWKIDYRKYHDVWLPKNRIQACWVNTANK